MSDINCFLVLCVGVCVCVYVQVRTCLLVKNVNESQFSIWDKLTKNAENLEEKKNIVTFL